MEKTINQFKAAVAAVVGLLTGLWGWLGWLVVGWIVCMALSKNAVDSAGDQLGGDGHEQ